MRRTMVGILIVAGACWATGAVAQEPSVEEADRTELARELLAVSGAGQMGLQVMDQMVDAFKMMNPEVTDDFWGEFWAEFMTEIDVDDMVEMVIPIYTEHLTAEEMTAAIDFYRTPAGQAILQKMPAILQESMEVGQQWGMEIGQRVAERLEKWKETRTDT